MWGRFPATVEGMADATRTGLRSDAVRNRDALLGAARAVFAERGLDVPLDEIARLAGVGNATLYRRFPTREHLVEAVFLDRLTEYVAAVDDALADPDPWSGFRSYLLRLFRWQAEDRGLADVLVTTTGPPGGALASLRDSGLRGARRLVDRAQAAGALRADFDHQDLPLLLMANAGLVRQTQPFAPAAWERVAAFVLDGLQERAATPAPPSPSRRQLLSVMGRDSGGRSAG